MELEHLLDFEEGDVVVLHRASSRSTFPARSMYRSPASMTRCRIFGRSSPAAASSRWDLGGVETGARSSVVLTSCSLPDRSGASSLSIKPRLRGRPRSSITAPSVSAPTRPGIEPECTRPRSGRSARRPDDRAMECTYGALGGGGAGNRTLVREASTVPSFTCVVVASPTTGSADSAATYLSLSSFALSRAPSRDAALVINAFGIPGRSLRRTAQRFSGRESECVIVVRTYNGPLDERIGRRHTQIRSQSPRRSRSPPWVVVTTSKIRPG